MLDAQAAMDLKQATHEVKLEDLFHIIIKHAGAIELCRVNKSAYQLLVMEEETDIVVEQWLQTYISKHPVSGLGIWPIPHWASIALPALYGQGRPVLMDKLLSKVPDFDRLLASPPIHVGWLINGTERAKLITDYEERVKTCAGILISKHIVPRGLGAHERCAKPAREVGLLKLAEFWESATFHWELESSSSDSDPWPNEYSDVD